jgi:prophage regulatory protein
VSAVLLPRREVEKRVGLKRSAIYDRMARGTFPKPIHDTESATVWWLESDIDAWVQARIDASRKQAA